MNNDQTNLRRIINEILLQEEVYGTMATVYHGSKTPPDVLIPIFTSDSFSPGKGEGMMYGRGVYTVYNLKGTQTSKGKYGKYIYKFGVNLEGFISFDPAVTELIYKKQLTPAQQAQVAGCSKDIVELLKDLEIPKEKITSKVAYKASKILKGQVKGIVYTGEHDGRVALIYDAGTIVPLSWKLAKSDEWNKIDRDSIRPNIDRYTKKSWSPGRYEKSEIKKLIDVAKLPIEDRIIDDNLDIRGVPVTSLPAGLRITGSANLDGTNLKSLPDGFEVGFNLNISDTQITELPRGLKVGGSLTAANLPITKLPDDIVLNGGLDLNGTQITSLPDNLNLNGGLVLFNTPIAKLPSGLRVWNLNIGKTQITELPEDLYVKWGSVTGFKSE
jgi:hypothetical protein